MRKLFLALCMVAAMCGCGSKTVDDGAVAKDEVGTEAGADTSGEAVVSEDAGVDTDGVRESRSVAVVAKDFDSVLWASFCEGVQECADEYGVQASFDGPSGSDPVSEQARFFNLAVMDMPDGILSAVAEPGILDEVKREALESGIVVQDVDLDEESCTEDEAWQAGYDALDLLLESQGWK